VKAVTPSPFKVSRYSGKGFCMPEETAIPWTGEGLPPVGSMCITTRGDYEREVLILCHGEKRVFVRDQVDGEEWGLLIEGRDFRPVLTPEQIAAEERLKAIDEMAAVYKSNYEGHVKDGCQALYDAGYRKVAP
jgi:hypothetical protein